MLIVQLFACILLIIMIYQDFKSREVSLVLLLLFGALGLVHQVIAGWDWISFGGNAMFLVLLSLIVLVFAALRKKPVQSLIGKGDLLYFIMLLPWFGFPEYLYAFTYSLIGSLVLHMTVSYLGWYRESSTITLISYFGIINLPIIVVS